MEKVDVSGSSPFASRTGTPVAESGSPEVHSDLCAVVLPMVGHDLRQPLHIIIGRREVLAGSSAEAAGRPMTPEVQVASGAGGGRVLSFGSFRLLPSQRLLLEADRRVSIGSRAFDILTFLVERAGEVVGKDELIARVWPNVFVEPSNLKFQISALRRVLGDGRGGNRYIVTVPGRGYGFVAPINSAEELRGPVAL